MSSPIIESFLIDDENEAEIAAHGLSTRQVIQLLDGKHVILPNRKKRRGLYLLIGRDFGGACIATPIERTHQPNVWRPITAWRCKSSEKTALEKEER